MRGRTPLTISIFENQCHTARACRRMQLPASLPTGNDVFVVCCCICDLHERRIYGSRHIEDSLRFVVRLRAYSVGHMHNLDVPK